MGKKWGRSEARNDKTRVGRSRRARVAQLGMLQIFANDEGYTRKGVLIRHEPSLRETRTRGRKRTGGADGLVGGGRYT